MIIIGITGTIGAGKGTVVEYLVRNKKFKHFSARDLIGEEVAKMGLKKNRDNMVVVANDLRLKHGSSYVADELYRRAMVTEDNCVIESLRTVGEIDLLKNKGNFVLLAVDADPKIRYERVIKRMTETDNVTFDKFLEDENKEMSSKDPNKQNLRKCIQMADFMIVNNKDINFLYQQVEEIYEQIKQRY